MEHVTYYRAQDIHPNMLSAEQVGILQELDQKIAGRQNLGDILDYLFDSTMDIYPCDRISVAFLDDSGERLVSYWTRTMYKEQALKIGYAEDVSSGSLATVLKSANVRIINDIKAYGKAYPDSRSTRLLIKEQIQSNLTSPLKVDDRIIGVLFRSSREAGVYTREHAIFQFLIAERLSQAVEKAYLIDLLESRNRDYMDMLAFVVHELKSPLATIIMNSDMLVKGFLGDVHDGQKDALERILRQGRRLNGLIHDYLDLARIESGGREPDMEDVDFIKSVIEVSIDEVDELIADKNIKIKKEYSVKEVTVSCDPGLIKTVLINLLTNAVKYGNDKGLITIRLTVESEHVKVAVRNQGAGFREEDRNRLFKRFSRLPAHEHSSVAGTGVGLYTCWRIINLHKGRIYASSEYGQWAEFSFRLPLNLHCSHFFEQK